MTSSANTIPEIAGAGPRAVSAAPDGSIRRTDSVRIDPGVGDAGMRAPGRARSASAPPYLRGPVAQPHKRALSPQLDEPTAKRTKPTRSPLETLPKELISHIVHSLPSTSGARVASLMRTSRTLKSKAQDATMAKARDCLVERVLRMAIELPDEQKCKEFCDVLTRAKELSPRLRPQDLADVFVALASRMDDLPSDLERCGGLMLTALEGLGRRWGVVTAENHEVRAHQQHELDRARRDIIIQLSENQLHPRFFFPAHAEDGFDRLCAVMESIEASDVKSDIASRMPLCNCYHWDSELIGVQGFRRLVDFVEHNRTQLSDAAIAGAVCSLAPSLSRHEQDADMTADFERLCGITASLQDDEEKTRAAVFLAARRGWLPEADDAKTRATAWIEAIADSVGHAELRERIRDVKPVVLPPLSAPSSPEA